MKINGFSSVKKDDVYEIKDFKKHCCMAEGLIAEENGIKDGLRLKEISTLLSDETPQKLYFVSGILFLYTLSGKLYKIDGENLRRVTNERFFLPPKIFPVHFEGKSAVGIVDKDNKIILADGEYSVSLPDGELYLQQNYRLFVARGSEIIACGQFDFENGSFSAEEKGVLRLPEEFGKIVAIESYSDTLLIFCERGIESLSAFGEYVDFTLKKEVLPVCDIVFGTVKSVGDKIYFVNRDKLFYYNKGGIVYVDCLLNDKNFKVDGESCAFLSTYILPVEINNEKYLYLFDTVSGTDSFIKKENLICSDGGFVVEKTAKKLYDLEKCDENSFYESYFLDFNSDKRKFLTAIKIKSSTPVTVKVFGDFGVESFDGSSGIIRCNLTSNEFKIKLEFFDKDVFVESIKMYYKG